MNKSLKRQVNEIPNIFIGATFEEIKKNLIDWLRGQDDFLDYDFSGSQLNVLVDLLAYNTLYIQQFSNAALYESFIRTANLRSSVVQSAQDMGYMPSSKTAASDTILVQCTHALDQQQIRIPRGTKFLGTPPDISVKPYNFVVMEDVTIQRDKNKKYIDLVKIAQGRIVRTELLYDPEKPILIRDPKIDRSKVKVWVEGALWEDATYEGMVFTGSTKGVFYMRETIDEHTEIFFGEGETSIAVAGRAIESNYVGGLKPTTGAVIVIEYLATDGEDANGCRNYTYVDTLQFIQVEKITENPSESRDYVGADGGGEPEEIERIRELAPLKRESQQRCVTASDYEAFVSEQFGSIVQAVQCFTDSDKPGYAFIAIKPKSGLQLTSFQREDIRDALQQHNLAPITPSIMSPNYLFLRHDIKVTYQMNTLVESEQWLEGKVIEQIDKYYIDEVEIFNKSFAKSRLLTYIDNSDISIIGSTAKISMVREIDSYIMTPPSGIKYYNQVVPGSFVTSDIDYSKEPEGESYPIRLAGTMPNENGVGYIVAGPFADGDITPTQNEDHIGEEYIGSDFQKRPNSGDRKKYYIIGTIDYPADNIYWNFGAISVASSNAQTANIELMADPGEDNIFTKDGSLIVFENDLRPQYTKITMEPIAQ